MKSIRTALVSALVGATVLAALPASNAAASDVYVVQPGDTAWSIALRHQISLADLVSINGLGDPDRIYVGDRLTVTGGTQAVQQPASLPAAGSHTVSSGETLSAIAARYGVLLADLATANGIVNLDRIYVGDVLTIPGGGSGGGGVGGAIAVSQPVYVSRDDAQAAVRAAAAEFGVPPSLLLALAYQESGFQQHVVSRAGAVGLMQIMPETAEWAAGYLIAGAPDYRNSATDNARMGAAIVRHLLILSGWDIDLALSGYYQGWGATVAHGPYEETWQYIANIRYFMNMFG